MGTLCVWTADGVRGRGGAPTLKKNRLNEAIFSNADKRKQDGED